MLSMLRNWNFASQYLSNEVPLFMPKRRRRRTSKARVRARYVWDNVTTFLCIQVQTTGKRGGADINLSLRNLKHKTSQ